MGDDKRRLPVQKTLPMTWKSGDNVIHDRAAVKPDGPLVMPNDRELLAFADQNAKTCGSCVHLRRQEKDRPEVRGFIATALYEAKWKLGWIAPDPKDLRRCSEKGDVVTPPEARACEFYREGRGSIR